MCKSGRFSLNEAQRKIFKSHFLFINTTRIRNKPLSDFVFTLLMLVGALSTYANLYFIRVRPESISLKGLGVLTQRATRNAHDYLKLVL